MIYRTLGKSTMRPGVIGLGCEHLTDQSFEAVDAVVGAAVEHGINLFDVFMPQPEVRSAIGRSLRGRRDKVMLQGHLGVIFRGQYERSRELADCKEFFDDLLLRYRTDYIDIGMFHFVDDYADFETMERNGVIDYALELKASGAIRALGFSSHEPVSARKLVQTGLFDVVMFSVNPAYDLMPAGFDAWDLCLLKDFEKLHHVGGLLPDRAAFYHECEVRGVGVTAMKSLGAGRLLKPDQTPFAAPLTVPQCCAYALDRPAVASVLVGCRTPAEVETAVAYCDATPAELDYSSILGGEASFSLSGKCMYCNHCLPCPVKIDIAAVNKYLDLARATPDAVPPTVQAHYDALKIPASACMFCGLCESRCPFGVPVRENMKLADQIFRRSSSKKPSF